MLVPSVSFSLPFVAFFWRPFLEHSAGLPGLWGLGSHEQGKFVAVFVFVVVFVVVVVGGWYSVAADVSRCCK